MYTIDDILTRIPTITNGSLFLKDTNPNIIYFFIKTTLSSLISPPFDFLTTLNGFIIHHDYSNYYLLFSKDTLLIKDDHQIISKTEKQPSLLMHYLTKEADKTLYMVIDDNLFYYQKEKENQIPFGGSLTSLHTSIKDKNYFEYQSISLTKSPKKIVSISSEFDYITQIFTKLETLIAKEEKNAFKKHLKISSIL